MRPKTLKAYKRTLHSYGITFGLHPPYQIILDADFIQAAIDQKLFIADELPKVFQDMTKEFVTECTVQELRRKGDKASTAALAAKKFERKRCPHTANPIASSECLRQIIGDENKYNYCIASQNLELREKLRQVPGVPLLYIKAHMVILEQMSSATKKRKAEKEQEKLISPKELELLKQAKRAYGLDDSVKQPPKKKKRAKGPNPLSVKKKKKVPPPPPKKKKAAAQSNENKQQ